MNSSELDLTYGPQATDQRRLTNLPTCDGARAALETFYYAFNQRDIEALSSIWLDDPLAQLNNPLGGILRGSDSIVELYSKIFSSSTLVQVTFQGITQFAGDGYAVFAGREIGNYTPQNGKATPLSIRTTRVFSYASPHNRWLQIHHHGSIDDAASLKAYQDAIASPTTR